MWRRASFVSRNGQQTDGSLPEVELEYLNQLHAAGTNETAVGANRGGDGAIGTSSNGAQKSTSLCTGDRATG